MLTDVTTGATRDLTPIDNVQVRLVAVGTQRPDEVLVEINDRRPDRHDLYRVNLQTEPASGSTATIDSSAFSPTISCVRGLRWREATTAASTS